MGSDPTCYNPSPRRPRGYRSAIADQRRRFVFARQGDTLERIAARSYPDDPQAAGRLSSWNLHLNLRHDPVGVDGPMLASDIVYLEPPIGERETTADEGRIVAAEVVAGHDGLAEVAVRIRHTNGAEQAISLAIDVVDDALDRSSITSLDQLIGQPWTIIAPDVTTGV